MPDLQSLINQFRAQLLRRDAQAERAIISAFALVLRRLEAEINALEFDLTSQGESLTQSYALMRFRALQGQIEREMRVFGAVVNAQIREAQADVIRAAVTQAPQLIAAGLPGFVATDFNRLSIRALQDLVGALQDGSPLRNLLDRLGPTLSQRAQEALIEGLALGRGPIRVARELQQTVEMGRSQAIRIARTEILRAYRSSSQRTYQENKDVVKGWIWFASLSSRTCLMCLLMHGTKHRLDEPFASHPMCRCTPLPETMSFAELGIEGVEETPIVEQTGLEWLQKQDAETLRGIMGEPAYKAWKAGEVGLEDFIGRGRSEFGPNRYTRSLKEILGSQDAVKFYKRAA